MRITNVEHKGGYDLEITFFTGSVITFNFESFLKTHSHPDIKKYLDIDEFSKVQLDTGFLSWNDGEMEISGEWVFEQHIKNITHAA